MRCPIFGQRGGGRFGECIGALPPRPEGRSLLHVYDKCTILRLRRAERRSTHHKCGGPPLTTFVSKLTTSPTRQVARQSPSATRRGAQPSPSTALVKSGETRVIGTQAREIGHGARQSFNNCSGRRLSRAPCAEQAADFGQCGGKLGRLGPNLVNFIWLRADLGPTLRSLAWSNLRRIRPGDARKLVRNPSGMSRSIKFRGISQTLSKTLLGAE